MHDMLAFLKAHHEDVVKPAVEFGLAVAAAAYLWCAVKFFTTKQAKWKE